MGYVLSAIVLSWVQQVGPFLRVPKRVPAHAQTRLSQRTRPMLVNELHQEIRDRGAALVGFARCPQNLYSLKSRTRVVGNDGGSVYPKAGTP